MSTPQLMAFVPTGPLGALPAIGVLPDWTNNLLYFITAGTSANCGIHQFNGYPSGDETDTFSLAELGLSEMHENGGAISPSGYLLGNEFDSNSTTLWEVYGRTGVLINQFGVPSSSLAPSGLNRVLTPGSIAAIRIGTNDVFFTTPLVSGFAELCSFTVPSLSLNNLSVGSSVTILENTAFVGPGPVSGSSGVAYVIASGGTTDAGFYKANVNAFGAGTFARVASLAPTSVDAAWTSIGVAGCALDQTDGNPIIYCHSAGATNPNYLVKLSGANGAVLWALKITGTHDSVSLANCAITKQIMYYLDGNGLFYTINTAAGTAVTQTIDSLRTVGSQISEDIYGSLIANGNWNAVTTTVDYVGTYMDTEGNHTLSDTWFRFMPNGAINPPPTPPVPSPGVVSDNKAWTYTLDGHTFYVLDLGTQGTYAFDTVTQQWSEFQTNGTNLALINGLMWGQRVVGGDPASGDLWEMDPAATKDSGGLYDIMHIVTGALSTRSRTYIAVSALRVSASFGELDDSGNVTFNLRFSDDQAQTWSPYYAVTLTEGAYDAEIAWRSLGSFNAPGRIFELSDSGGLIRIDGCDAFLDGFDNDQQSQDAP